MQAEGCEFESRLLHQRVIMQPVTRQVLERLIEEGHAASKDVSHLERELCWKYQSKDDGFDKSQCDICEHKFFCFTHRPTPLRDEDNQVLMMCRTQCQYSGCQHNKPHLPFWRHMVNRCTSSMWKTLRCPPCEELYE